MSKIGEFHFVSESYLLDFRGRVTIPMMGNYLLHASSTHAEQRGFGFNAMASQGCAWVLSRMVIEMKSYPTMLQPFTITTWVEDANKLFTSRCFAIRNAEGEAMGYCRTLWAAIDLESRKPTDLARLDNNLHSFIVDEPCPIEKPGKIQAAEKDTEGEPYKVRYSDLDVNGHFNSIKYIEHLLDMSDLSMFADKEVSRFEIAYMAEGKYGMEMFLHKKEIDPLRYVTSICDKDGKAICRAEITWK